MQGDQTVHDNVPNPGRNLANAAAQVRAFNHASIHTGTDWQYPSHAYDAIGQLAHMLRMLPQALEQTVRPVTHTHEHGRLYVDGGGDPAPALGKLRTALDDATELAASLSEAVDAMHSATSPMGARLDDNHDDDASRCGRCRKPFDPTDARHDGHAQYSYSPFCRHCVDRCHESSDAFHMCPVCRGGEAL